MKVIAIRIVIVNLTSSFVKYLTGPNNPLLSFSQATKILKLAKDVYKDQDKCLLIIREKQILLALNFNVRFADPYSLLMYYVSSLDQMTRHINEYDIIRIYFCGSYLV